VKRQSLSLLLAWDVTGLVLIAVVAVSLGLTSNLIRSKPLPLFSFETATTEQDAPLPEITLAALQAAVDRHDGPIVDARPAAFYQIGHVPGALNLPLSDLQNDSADLQVPFPKEATIIVYCEDVSCTAARSAARILQKRGYRHVILFSGGWYIWHKAGLPSEGNP
jgi:rhodanese-related sulfurtransferase